MIVDSIAEALGVTKGLIYGSAGGAAVSAALNKKTWAARLALIPVSFVLATLTAGLVMWGFDVPAKLEMGVGCLLGVFGVMIADRLAETIREINLVEIVSGWFRRIFGGSPPSN